MDSLIKDDLEDAVMPSIEFRCAKIDGSRLFQRSYSYDQLVDKALQSIVKHHNHTQLSELTLSMYNYEDCEYYKI